MTGGNLLPVAAVLVAVLAANLALAWLLARRDWEPPSVLDSAGPDSETARPSGPEPGLDGGSATVESGVALDAPGGDPPPLDVDGETVVCRHCGAENRPEYRYCRWCVRSGFDADGPGAAAGPTMTERSL
ncbi:zinc ribbon domain-containing protein [Halorubrum sp. AD140]|uniref:DUF7577 domain-containing protein n=1 Tax=Halorubrum sp. AD140 TaxID=3050073 RepID=UPI002ACC4F35|nr:zinc ribbon domain-containing protein [Halorubrum sp. AD140]MDZ5812549.1 zinc ribbon domain-containing protein [Halorubrum sp. AD140]